MSDESTKCSRCEKVVDTVVTFSVGEGDETKPLCMTCFKKAGEEVVANLKLEPGRRP